MTRNFGIAFMLFLFVANACNQSDTLKSQVSEVPSERVEEPHAPEGVTCAVEFKEAQKPFKVGQAYRLRIRATKVSAEDIVVASTNGSSVNYIAEADGYNYLLTASRQGIVKLLIFHRAEVGENPLCTIEYSFE